MLPKENRLKKKKDFEQVFKEGKGFEEDFLFLKIRKSKSKETRFGFVVSQKVSKKAVVRNKIKRRLREIIREEIPLIQKGTNGVFVIKKNIVKKDFQEVRDVIIRLLKKSGILND